ncbi:MAG: tetratricopeptide repeat protein [Planctomycetes bacterium]|nr:tetratricopeptide repeat protein [Planctomycetota bacterium]
MTQKYQYKVKIKIISIITLMVLMSAVGSAAVSQSPKNRSSRTLRTMARVYMTYGEYGKARGFAEKALNTARQMDVGANEMALCMIDAATVYSNLGMFSESQQLFLSGIQMQKQALFDTHPYVAQTYRMLSDLQRRAGELEQAEQSLASAVSIMLNHCDIQSNEMSPFVLESAKLLAAKGEFEYADANYRMALDMIRQNYGPRHLMTANVLENIAQCCFVQNELERADAYINEAITIRRGLFGRQNMMLVDVWLTKARICRAQGQLERSEYYLTNAAGSIETCKDFVKVARIHEQISRVRNENAYVAAVN